jgi:protein-disulfide isomerase
LLRAGFATGAAAFCLTRASDTRAQEITLDSIVNDPDAPVAGNPKGDVVIVAFLDYNCQYCKKSAPDLDGIVKTDGGVKLVYKDCPVLTEASVFGARMALAAKYQGAYELVHATLMRVPGKRNPQSYMEDAVATSGVDMERLKADLETHGPEIDALIKRNLAQAQALGFEGVPNFLIGPCKANGAIDYETFKLAVAQARELAHKN